MNMSGIPQLSPIGSGQLSVPSSYPSQLPLSRYFDMGSSQYGVSSGIASGLGGLANAMPIIGPILGAGLNLYAQQQQNNQQQAFFEQYMSPSARMAQMRAAGINPAAAAQGISGSATPQMNAAAPTNAFSSLGEALGNSVNTALSAQNIAAQTKNLEVQSEGQELQNKMTEVELGMKPDMLTAELDDLKESANEKRQTVINLKKEVEKSNQEIKTLKSEENYNVAKTGQVDFENRLMEAQAERERAAAALAKAEKELTDVNKKIREKDYDNYLTPEEQIKMPIETEANTNYGHNGIIGQSIDAIRRFVGTGKDYGFFDILSGLGITFDNHNLPHFRPIDNLFGRFTRPSYDKWLSGMKSNIRKSQDELINALNSGKISKSDYKEQRQALNQLSGSLDYNTYKETFGIK